MRTSSLRCGGCRCGGNYVSADDGLAPETPNRRNQSAGDGRGDECELRRVPKGAVPGEKDRAAKAFEYVGAFHEKRQDYDQAIEAAKSQRAVAAPYEEGRILNRVAALHGLCNRPEQADAARREVVALLTDKVRPAARSVFGAMMTFDYFEAVWSLSTSTVDEKRVAAELVLNHDISSAETKRKVRERLDGLDRR